MTVLEDLNPLGLFGRLERVKIMKNPFSLLFLK